MTSSAPLSRERSRDRIWIPCLSFLLSGGALLAAMACFGISPFGESTLFIADMRDQYVHFHAYLRHTLLGEQSALYSTAAGLGANMLPLFAYYLSSPLSLLTLLFPLSSLPEALLLITILKVGLAGAAYAVFARRVLEARRSSLVFAPCFALCGFAMCYASNIMWLDALVLLPLALRGAHSLVTNRRWGGLFCSLLLMFFTQFYLAYMAGIFIFLCFLGMLWIYKPVKPLGIALRFTGAAVCAALCCAVTLVPTAIQLFSNIGLATFEANTSWEPVFPFFSVFSRAFFGAFDTIQARSMGGATGLPPLYSGTLVLLALPVYFLNKRIPWRERVVTGAVSLLLLISFWLPPLTFFWHAFDSAAWFQFRFTFLLSFLWVWAAHRNATRLEGVRAWSVLLGGAAALLYVTVLYPNTFVYTPGFARALAPWLIALWTAALLWTTLSPKSRGVAVLVCAALATAEMGGNAYATLVSIDQENQYVPRAVFAENMEQRAALLAQLPQDPDDPYRVDSDTSYSRNDSLTLGYNSLQFYSSTAYRKLGNTFMRLGLGGVGLIYVHEGSTIALDSLLGIRYLLEPSAPNDYYPSVAENGEGLHAFNNPYAFPLAFAAPRTVLDYRLPDQPYETTYFGEVIKHEDPFTLQNGMFAALGREVFIPLPVEDTEYVSAVTQALPEGGELITAVDASDDESSGGIPGKRILARTDSDGPVYLYFAQYNEGGAATVYLEDGGGSPVYTLLTSDAPSAAYLGDYGADEEIPLEFQLDDAEVKLACQSIVQLDMAALDELYYGAWDAQMHEVSWQGNRLSGVVDVVDDRDTLLLTVPYDSGWSATVNGADVPVERGLDLFCAVPLSEGRNYVKLTYTPPGLTLGIWLSALGLGSLLACFAVSGVLTARRRRASRKS